jgi:glycerophosphoryl diester phosphodiesterase
MYIIAHRGNTNGPCEDENSIDQILGALSEGFDVEIDVRTVDGILYLGHDEPQEILPDWLIDKFNSSLWIHCKDIDSLYLVSTLYPNSNYFWHQSDDATVTSKGYFWTYPGKQITEKSILVLPEILSEQESNSLINNNPYAICTDYPFRYDKAD